MTFFLRCIRTAAAALLLAILPVLFPVQLTAAPMPKYVDVEEAQLEVDQLEAELAQARTDRETYRAEETDLEKRIIQEKRRKAKLEQALEDLQNKISELYRRQDRLPDKYDRLAMDSDIAEAENLRSQVIEEIKKSGNTVEELEQEKKEANRRKRIAEAEIGKAEERLPDLKAAINRTNAEQAKLESDLQAAREALKGLDDILKEFAEE